MVLVQEDHYVILYTLVRLKHFKMSVEFYNVLKPRDWKVITEYYNPSGNHWVREMEDNIPKDVTLTSPKLGLPSARCRNVS